MLNTNLVCRLKREKSFFLSDMSPSYTRSKNNLPNVCNCSSSRIIVTKKHFNVFFKVSFNTSDKRTAGGFRCSSVSAQGPHWRRVSVPLWCSALGHGWSRFRSEFDPRWWAFEIDGATGKIQPLQEPHCTFVSFLDILNSKLEPD